MGTKALENDVYHQIIKDIEVSTTIDEDGNYGPLEVRTFYHTRDANDNVSHIKLTGIGFLKYIIPFQMKNELLVDRPDRKYTDWLLNPKTLLMIIFI